MTSTTVKTFQAEHFRSTREWIYFCLEFDLELCRGCYQRARKKSGESPWRCSSCEPALHPDLIVALETRANVATRCALCQETVSIRDCWISEDGRRLYCAEHLEPLRKKDRFRLARGYLTARFRPDRRRESSLRQLSRHETRVDCESCAFNARGVYDGEHLVEIDRGGRRCDSIPDTLNCADLGS